MRKSLLELQVSHEIAMATGRSLDLKDMLQESLTAYLRKLNCSAGAVFMLEREAESDETETVYQIKPVYSIPRELKRNTACTRALEHIPTGVQCTRREQFIESLPIHGRDGDRAFYHIMELPGFGLILLVKNNIDLEGSILRSLSRLNKKLADSCIACLQNQRVKQYNELLKKEIRRREEMEQALLKAKKLEAVGTLAGGVAHDFNNLLSIILGNVSLAKMETPPGSALSGLLADIENASLRGRDLILKFITFSSGGDPIRKPIDLKKLVKTQASLECKGSNVVHRGDFSHDLWMTEADEGQLKHVFHNIVQNAKEAMSGGGTITVSAHNIHNPPTVPLPEGPYVKISFRDEGKGIPKEELANVFDPYYSTKRKGTEKGTGLGLSIAYSIVKKHGGFIQIESESGLGTEVCVYLPASVKERETAAAVPVSPSSTVPGGKKRVLVMDDEPMMLDLSVKILDRLGYESETAANGAEAVESYRRAMVAGKRFDLVILDLTVKNAMDGQAAIKKLLEIDPDVAAVAAVAAGGYADSPILSSNKQYGFKAAISKPFRMAQFKETLESALARSG